jgi:hypothetical protein
LGTLEGLVRYSHSNYCSHVDEYFFLGHFLPHL